jgi:hypothetical protein
MFAHLFGPGPFDKVGVEHFMPAMLTLDVCTVLKVAGYSLPIMQSLGLHHLSQLVVLSITQISHNQICNLFFFFNSFLQFTISLAWVKYIARKNIN